MKKVETSQFLHFLEVVRQEFPFKMILLVFTFPFQLDNARESLKKYVGNKVFHFPVEIA